MKNNQKGFTLIELVSSLFILIAILEVFIFISSSVSNSSLLRDNLIAANLAQEGLEVARNIRDQDWFLGNSYGTSLPNGTWRVQWDSDSLLPLNGNPPIKKDPVSGIFSYDSGFDTYFRRILDVSNISSSEIRVISTITWGNARSTSAEAHFFNWYAP